jgi:hypothetical protein
LKAAASVAGAILPAGLSRQQRIAAASLEGLGAFSSLFGLAIPVASLEFSFALNGDCKLVLNPRQQENLGRKVDMVVTAVKRR